MGFWVKCTAAPLGAQHSSRPFAGVTTGLRPLGCAVLCWPALRRTPKGRQRAEASHTPGLNPTDRVAVSAT